MFEIIRGLAVAIALAGAFSAATQHPSNQSNGTKVTNPSCVPVPTCPPNDPGACNINKW